jgi:nucleoside-diphosphate-sugar epimerase
MSRTALVVGGTGPSGPHMLAGLRDRGFTTTIFHTGRHEPPELADVEHIHGDPFTKESIADSLRGREFDVTIATYGRIRHIAAEMAGKCEQFISVGGTPIYSGFIKPEGTTPYGLPVHVRENDPLVPPEGVPDAIYGVGAVRRTEDAVFDLHRSGAFAASVFRYPSIYGPRNPHAWEWSTIKRVLDAREFIVVPDAGLAVHSRLSSWNAAHSVLLAVDNPAEAAGQAFNCADDDQFSLRQWIELILEHMGATLEIVPVRGDIPSPGLALVVFRYDCSPHVIVDTSKIRSLLGYQDVKPARLGLSETVDWYVANRSDSDTWPVLDPFDYPSEDEFRVASDRACATLSEAGKKFLSLPTMHFPQTASGAGQNPAAK